MAACLGEMRMGLRDFEALTVLELAAVRKAWVASRHDSEKREWERMRMSVCLTLQPFLSSRLTPSELLPLPWDKDGRLEELPRMSAQEQKRRYDHYRAHGAWPG